MDDKKVALITGGATGIGKECALLLAGLGIHIALNYSRSEKDARETAKLVEAKGVSCWLYQADVGKDQEVRSMVASVVKQAGRLDYVVNSAGATDFINMADLEEVSEEHWDKVLSINVKGVFYVCRAAAPHLKEAHGSIVNITSLSGLTGQGSSVAYATSKGAAISLTKSLALALAPVVRVNSVAPGPVLTRWMAGREEGVLKFGARTPLGKVCSPRDVADVVVPILVSAGMMTGQTVVVDGGSVNGAIL
ncbi:MAG: SDR family NAD(P)-dependent oxidoreductase [Negativicutes bacterium]|nr:SDR family NAD(P)-dependent oxidoreductase [Negativicutes bacterium]